MCFSKDIRKGVGWPFAPPSIWNKPQGGSAGGFVTIPQHSSWYKTDVTATGISKSKQKKKTRIIIDIDGNMLLIPQTLARWAFNLSEIPSQL